MLASHPVKIEPFKMKVVLVLAVSLVLLVGDVPSIAVGSPIPGFAGLPDLGNLGHGFGMAKIGNIIKGNTYDGLERALKKISLKDRKAPRSSDESGTDSDGDGESSMFGFSGKQFEQLISMLQESQSGAQKQQQAAPAGAFPLAAIDNSVD
ncbi:VTC2-like protein [Anopheles sinensis]|uniref:VTC2-like protein n=1 Tax=Anopheles sinensis TaxID=74873 RepID=A0A084WA36_ANOSI|nr:VTC2-like protein [Anopheles sinensis]